ncbi:MAG: hypothetical protein KDK25_13975 [Leptospiraceae bacterium]|nr:hypothetical protein [Leptospiraceae bacterium]
MKNVKSIWKRIPCMLLAFALLSCATIPAPDATPAGALAHMKQVGNPVDPIRNNMLKYMQSVAHSKDPADLEQKRRNLINSVGQAIQTVRAVSPYKGDNRYRESTLELLETMYAILTEDYGRLVDLKKIAEQSYDTMEAYMEARRQANEKLEEAGDDAARVEENFAKDYKINLISKEDELGRKLKLASAAMGHQSDLFLIYFKPYKQEVYLIEALDRNDISGIEQNRESLAEYAREGQSKLASVQPHRGDDSLIRATKALLDFYEYEAEKTAIFVDLALKKDRLERAKRSIDSTDPANRTREQVDSFNKLVNEYNTLVNRANAVNNELNQKRKGLTDQWNNFSDSFLARHVPR